MVHPGLNPTRRGFETCWYGRLNAVNLAESKGEFSCLPGSLGFIEHQLSQNSAISFGEKYDSSSLITAAMVLFTGRPSPQTQQDFHDTSALSVNGICVYQDILREPSLDAELTSHVHVIPGKIDSSGRPFSQVKDQTYSMKEGRRSNEDGVPAVFKNVAQSARVRFRVRETVQTLHTALDFNFSTPFVFSGIGPKRLTSRVTFSGGVLRCLGHTPETQDRVSIRLEESFNSFTWGDHLIWLFRGNLAACIAVFALLDETCRLKVLINDINCLDCCLDLITKTEGERGRRPEESEKICILWETY